MPLDVPGLLAVEQQITQQMAQTLEMLEEKYLQAYWTHNYIHQQLRGCC